MTMRLRFGKIVIMGLPMPSEDEMSKEIVVVLEGDQHRVSCVFKRGWFDDESQHDDVIDFNLWSATPEMIGAPDVLQN